MRILDWNIEWMNRWFSGNASPQWGSNQLSAARANEAATRVAAVIRQLDPDLIMLQEGPSALAEMELFLADHLSDAAGPLYSALIGSDGGAQKLYALTKRNGAVASIDYLHDERTEALREAWAADVDGDMHLAPYDFTRQPLILTVDGVASQPFTMVNLHTKSKFVQGGQQLWADPARRQEFVVQALTARRRISAEGYRLRAYLDEILRDDPAARILVTGDFNDGPGHDLFERSYLTHNVADIVLGSTFYPELMFEHILLNRVATPVLFTARFDDFVDEVMDRPLLLDHFLVSPGMKEEVHAARIAHEEYEAEVVGNGEPRHKRPSDHRPILLELSGGNV